MVEDIAFCGLGLGVTEEDGAEYAIWEGFGEELLEADVICEEDNVGQIGGDEQGSPVGKFLV